METIKNWAILILGILCLLLYYSNVHKEDQMKTVEETATQILIDCKQYIKATNVLLDETCDYVEERYNDYLPDTLWEGDAYDNTIFLQEVLMTYHTNI